MANKKVYDLAKEYNVASKDFVKMLQDADIPVKNHMSSVTEQQEKYFKNNYVVVDGRSMTKDEAEKIKAAAEKTATALELMVEGDIDAAMSKVNS